MSLSPEIEGAGPAAEEVAAPEVVTSARRGNIGGAGMFAGALVVAALSFAPALLVMSGGRYGVAPDVEEKVPTPQPTTAAPARTQAPAGAIRVTNGTGSSVVLASGQYQVTFVWTVEGAREGDPVLIRFSVGSQTVSEQRGVLDPSIFAFSSGTLTIRTTQECSASGWTAELLEVRGQIPTGAAIARAAGAACR